MSNVPEQVRRRAERANELLNQVNPSPGEPPQETPAPEPETPTPEVPATPAPEPVEPSPPAEPAPAPAAPVPPVATDWEHKYKTLQGVLSAETGRLLAEKKVLESRIAELERTVTEARKAAPAPAPAAPANDEDTTLYGPELIATIERRARKIAETLVAEQVAALKPELDQTRQQVTSVASQVYKSSEERFYGELAKTVPDWESVNADPRWLEWLGQADPLSGAVRQSYLDHASQHLDHVRVAALFNAFKDAAGLNQPATPVAPAPVPAKPALSPSPRPVGTASAPTPREPQTGVRRSEIAAHYRRGATDPSYRSSPAHKEMEQRIATAMASGNVIEA